jgi:DNA polymerase-3 subunit beta
VNFIIDQSELVRLATRSKSVVPSNPTAPVLGCAIITARVGMLGQTGGLSVLASDPSMAYVGDHPATVTEPGKIALAADDLLKTAKALPSGPVTVSVNDRLKVTLTSGRNKFTLDGLATDEHPGVAQDEAGSTMTVDAGDLLYAMSHALTAAAKDDDKRGFSGVKIEDVGVVDGKQMCRFLGMDGLRLMWADVTYSGTVGGGVKSMVPCRALVELKNMIGGMSGPVTISLASRSITVSVPGARLTSRMLEAEIPDYRQIIPTKHERSVMVDRGEWDDALGRVAVFAAVANTVRVTFGADGIAMSASKLDAGAAQIEVDAELVGEPITIGLNVGHVRDALKAFGGRQVVIELGGPLSLIVMRDPDDAFARFVCGPMRLEGV